MPRSVRISLANKCQILFGAAVILILTAALAIVWLRMQTLVNRGPHKRAQDFANAWLADQIQLGGALTPIGSAVEDLPADIDLTLSLLDEDDFDRIAQTDPFIARALELFQLRPEIHEQFGRTLDVDGRTYYRYVRAIRKSDLSRICGGAAAGFQASLDTTALADPLKMMLIIHLRDPEAHAQAMLNRIYIVAAGLVAGLLAIAAFWFITTRIILSPVRLLRTYAQKVSEGNMNIRSDINTGDEFEQLSNIFNTMLANLKKNEDQLRSINKSLDLKLGELAESNVALYEANKIKGDFLANVSHELRTPLNSIIGFAEVLQETLDYEGDADSDKRKRYTANIITSSRRLLNLITELLDLAKIEAGRMELNTGPVSIADTCEGLINLIRPQAEKREIQLKQKIDPATPIVETDPGKLQQILFNLLSNAIKFTPPGGSVTLSALPLPPQNAADLTQVRISVSDTGPGIPAEDHARIFEKFTQLNPVATREQGGTGLGLTISKELAEMLQGHIELDSDTARGATFSLVIPVTLEPQSTPLMPEIENNKQ